MCLADYIWAHLPLGRPESQSQTHLLAAKRPAAVRARCCLVHFWGREVSVLIAFPCFSPGARPLRPGCRTRPTLHHPLGTAETVPIGGVRQNSHILNMASFPGTILCSMNMLWIFIAQFDFIPQPEVELRPNVSFTGHTPWVWKTSLLLSYLCFLLWADRPLSQARGGHLWKLQLVSSTCSARSAVQGTGPGGGWF